MLLPSVFKPDLDLTLFLKWSIDDHCHTLMSCWYFLCGPASAKFALVDDRGQVLSFVTPSPDVNLQPYLGHRVGVAGNRGFIAEFHRSHVTAARVTPLNDRMVWERRENRGDLRSRMCHSALRPGHHLYTD